MINNSRVGKQLQELRKAKGLRQYEIAEKVGLSRSAISNIESGKRSLTLATLKRFCEVFNIDISYFNIDTRNYDEAVDLTARLEKIFSSNEIEEDEKDKLYRDIMQIYLNNKK